MESASILKKRFTVDECYRMLESGILSEDDRFELIDGELVDMGPMSSLHARCIFYLNRKLLKQSMHPVEVAVQLPLRINEHTEPEPDIQVLKPGKDYYGKASPAPEDVLLLIEVSLTSVHIDTHIKLPMYARHGIREVWIVDLDRRMIHQYTAPSADAYQNHRVYQPGETLSAERLAGISFAVRDILGPDKAESGSD